MTDFAVPETRKKEGKVLDAAAKERLAVIATNGDATESKYCAVRAGYWDDPFIEFFVPPTERTGLRKPPLINRGTMARVAAIDSATQHFFQRGGRQVVVLGAGFDTSYARLKRVKKLPGDVLWVEVDLPEVAKMKNDIIRSCEELAESFSGNFSMHGVDMNDLEALKHVVIEVCGVDVSKPTLFLSEVVLVYMEPAAGDRVIEWAGTAFKSAMFVTFEQIVPGDAFGRMMLSNISARGCTLHSISSYPDTDTQRDRYKQRGFTNVVAHNMNRVWDQLVASNSTAARYVMNLEIFDEVEEWQMLQDHYCFVVAIRDPDHLLTSDNTDVFALMLPYTPKPTAMLPAWNQHQQHLPAHPLLGHNHQP